jgi:type I restriction enzyme, R subunit
MRRDAARFLGSLELRCASSDTVTFCGLGDDDYLAREARARKAIDRQLLAAGWAMQGQNALNLSVSAGVAVREFTLGKAAQAGGLPAVHRRQARRVIEAKPDGTTLTEVERQSGKSGK